MSIVQEKCPACGAPVPVQPGTSQLQCAYCRATLRIERRGVDVSVELVEQVLGTIEQSGAQTQAELRRLHLMQELSVVQLNLANVKSEMRSIQRSSMNGVSRNHLKQLHQQSIDLEGQIAQLQAELDPTAPAGSVVKQRTQLFYSPQRLIWLLFTLDGRANRMEFWIGTSVIAVIALALTIMSMMVRAILGGIGADASDTGMVVGGVATFFNLITVFLWLAFFWIVTAVGVKRFQDRDKPGWWMLIGFIPMFGAFWLFVELGLLEGTPGPNRYG